MSVYKFFISKNEVARLTDANITYEDTDGTADVDVTLTVNGTEIHAATLVDAGCVLQYTGTLAEGYHTVKIQPEAGKPTDIRIDHVLIDDNKVVGSQYLMDTRIFGKSEDYATFKCCKPFRSPKNTDHVWWGEVWNSDYTVVANTTHYRPHVVTDTGQWWEWSFSVTSNGHIHWTVDETDSLLYDSTENNCYYAGVSHMNDSTTYPVTDITEVSQWISDHELESDSSTATPYWLGAGVYDLNFIRDENLTLGEQLVDRTTFLTESEYNDAVWFYNMYWPRNNIEVITIT